MSSEKVPQVTIKESPHRKITYTEEFKALLDTHPHLFATFQKIVDKMKTRIMDGSYYQNDIFSETDDGIIVTAIGYTGSETDRIGVPLVYLKVQVEEEVFFVKRIPGYYSNTASKGVGEVGSLREAKQLLKDMEYVDVVDFQFAYEDNEHQTYFVSRWEEGFVLNEYLDMLKDKILKEGMSELSIEVGEIQAIFEKINNILNPVFRDFNEANILYNPVTKKFIIFDIYNREKINVATKK